MIDTVLGAVVSAKQDEDAFRTALQAMPEDKRQDAIQSRDAERIEQVRRREHADLVEAAKPHSFWSFFGLGRK